ncbi:ankyrin repeat domain-containing protein, partial [Thiolapillus sp.]
MNFRILLGGLLLLVSFHTLAGDAELNKELRLSAIVDDVESIEKLLAKGADVNSANKYGKTALMMAAENWNLAAASVLLAHGADVNRKTVASCTALTLAAENDSPEVTALLIERGADLNARTRAGATAL